jgi:hypothetical protein
VARKEKEPEVPVWTGDINQCWYCTENWYPHEHQPEEKPARAPRKGSKAPKREKTSNAVKKESTGRRGRPMSPENFALLAVCNGHA